MRKQIPLLVIAALVVTGCGDRRFGLFKRGDKTATAVAAPQNAETPLETTTDAAPLTVAEASKVTPSALAAATKPVTRPEQDKGTTIASLGLLERDGFWLRTPLVSSEAKGRVVVEKSGASVNVMLVPSGAEAGSGSQLSIAAMQVLAIPITDLVEVRVFIR
nr:hypothetical protein [Amylibacter sp.]